jgi:hypothetical protein
MSLPVYSILVSVYAVGITYLLIRVFFGSKETENKLAESQKKIDELEVRREQHVKYFKKHKNVTVSDNDDELASTGDRHKSTKD